MRQSNTTILNNFQKKGIRCRIDTTSSGIRYVESGNRASDTAILYVHGAPGSCDAFFYYMQDSTLNEKFLQITVDRKGYGYSDYGHSETSIEKQAEALKDILFLYPNKKWILVGHSFGCAIAAVLAVHHNSFVSKVILAGTAADPEHEKMVGWAKISDTRLVRWISSNDLKVATDEKLSHQNELIKIESIWSKIESPIVLVHGTKDFLVPYENMYYLQKRIRPKLLTIKTLEGGSHIFVFTQPEILKNILLNQ